MGPNPDRDDRTGTRALSPEPTQLSSTRRIERVPRGTAAHPISALPAGRPGPRPREPGAAPDPGPRRTAETRAGSPGPEAEAAVRPLGGPDVAGVGPDRTSPAVHRPPAQATRQHRCGGLIVASVHRRIGCKRGSSLDALRAFGFFFICPLFSLFCLTWRPPL